MKTKAKILIEIEVDDLNPHSTEVKEMVIEGDAVTLSIALLSAGWGMFDETEEIAPQLEEKINFQKAVATCLLNGTITMHSNMDEDVIGNLSVLLRTLTDTNIELLEQEVQDTFLTKRDNNDEQGGTKPSDFSTFS
tara:strand:- start:804 stop:1211 length:408 start_codon:yes stop_codon:yes gene_type:complete